MPITFTDKNGRTVVISGLSDTSRDIVLKLLLQLPSSEFICAPCVVITR